jgi:hypothetical protein
LKIGHGRLPVTKPIEPPTLKTDLNALGKPGAFNLGKFPPLHCKIGVGFLLKYEEHRMPRTKGSISKDRSLDAEALREVLKPIYAKMREKGVSDSDLPDNEELVGRLIEFIDDSAIDQWVDKYAGWVKEKP